MTAARLRPGDVLRVAVDGKHALLQYVGRHRAYGDVVVVGPQFTGDPPLSATTFERGYVAFYPARLALKKGFVEICGNLPAPPVPTRLRRAGVRRGAQVETWIIEDESGETLRRDLSPEERQLPIASLWNHEFLVGRIRSGWRPEDEISPEPGADASSGSRRGNPSQGSSRVLSHYFYGATQSSATRASDELRRHGLNTSVRPSATGAKWLVLATHEATPSTELSRAMEGLAASLGCEYDGWEAKYPSDAGKAH